MYYGKQLSDTKIKEDVKSLMLSNVIQGHNAEIDEDYSYIAPSPSHYPYQWFWDTCFHVIILCALGEHALAKQQIKSLFAMQREDGFIGHMLFWESKFVNSVLSFMQSKAHPKIFIPHMSSIIQPPLPAQATLRIFEDTKDLSFLTEFLPKLKRYHEWLWKNRNFENTGLLSIISPFESGMDSKPSFDEVLGFKHAIADELLFERMLWVEEQNFLHKYNLATIYKEDYFIVKEVTVNTFYALDLLAMETLCKKIKDVDETIYHIREKKASESIQKILFDEKEMAYLDVYGKQNKKIPVLTPTIFYPLVLPNVSSSIAKKIVEKHLLNTNEFAMPFPLPSVAKNDPAFQPNHAVYLWRGPTWIISNWVLQKYLIHNGFIDEAERLYNAVRELITKSGFREYYNPFTGEGYGAEQFTWSGLIVDMMRIRDNFKNRKSSY